MRLVLGVVMGFGMMVLAQGCAFDLVHVKQTAAALDTTPQVSKGPFELQEDAPVDLGTGFSRTLKSKTKWDYFGSLSQGDVYRTADQVLTVEASNISEAYIVVRSGKLVGFYLPVEKTFSPLPDEILLKMAKIEP